MTTHGTKAKKGRKPRPGPDKQLLTQVRARFDEAGISIAEWARLNSYHYMTVLDLLHGRRRGCHGEAHRVAVALGLKKGLVVDAASFNPSKQGPE